LLNKDIKKSKIKELEKQLNEIEAKYIKTRNEIVNILENTYDSTIKSLNEKYNQDVMNIRHQGAILELIKVVQLKAISLCTSCLPVDVEDVLNDHNYTHLVIILEALRMFM